MGRPYKNELIEMKHTFEQYLDCDNDLLFEYMCSNTEIPMIIVGSGGSYAVAVAYSLFYQANGGMAKAVTPYELPENHRMIPNAKVLIITAGGSNKDSVGAYEYIRFYEPKMLMVFCIRKNSVIEKKIKENKDALFFRPAISIAKDGFLSVNSSIAMLSILWKIENIVNKTEVNDIALSLPSFEDQRKQFSIIFEKDDLETLLIMHGIWGKPAAYDLESKCSEAGLYNVQVVDYRNFAHGRHNWIDKKGKTTVVLALITDEDISIAKRTLKRLPDDTVIIDIRTKTTGIAAIIDFMVKMMYLVDILGDLREIDPGRPQVPQYGREVYGLKVDYKKMDKDANALSKSEIDRAIFRIIGTKFNERSLYRYYKKKYYAFVDKLSTTVFRGIVFDYDRTIYDRNFGQISAKAISQISNMLLAGIYIGFITTEGYSVVHSLKNMIPCEELWDRIYIGYHSGTISGWLSDLREERISEKKSTNIKKLYSLICNNSLFSDILVSSNHLSIKVYDSFEKNYAFEYCTEIIADSNIKNLKVFKAEYSVDVIDTENISKLYINEFNTLIDDHVLCIGDGNNEEDRFEMLSNNILLSVKNTNIVASNGWNLAPLGCHGIYATEYYLSCILIHNGGFRVDITS